FASAVSNPTRRLNPSAATTPPTAVAAIAAGFVILFVSFEPTLLIESPTLLNFAPTVFRSRPLPIDPESSLPIAEPATDVSIPESWEVICFYAPLRLGTTDTKALARSTIRETPPQSHSNPIESEHVHARAAACPKQRNPLPSKRRALLPDRTYASA